MQPNIERNAPPAITHPKYIPTLRHNASACALAFSITLGSTVAHEDYSKRMSIGPASLSASADRTNSIWFEDRPDAGKSWLAKVVAEMHAAIPDKEWEGVPDTSKIDIDTIL